MIELRSIKSQSTVEEKLSSSGLQQIRSAHHFRDVYRMIVRNNGELVGRNVVSPPDYEITKVFSSRVRLWPEMLVHERNLFSVGNPEPPIHAGGMLKGGRISPCAAFPRIDRLVIRIVGCSCRMCQLLARACARIDESAVAQDPPRLRVDFSPLTLRVRGMRPTAVGAFVPLQSQPAQVFIHCGDVLRPASVWIKVFIAEDERTAGALCPLCGNQESARVAEVKIAGGRRSETPTIGGHTGIVIRRSGCRPLRRLDSGCWILGTAVPGFPFRRFAAGVEPENGSEARRDAWTLMLET